MGERILRLLRLKIVRDRTGLNPNQIYQLMTEGRFPKNVLTGKRSVAWVESEIDEWIASRIAARNDGSMQKNPGGPGRGRVGPMSETIARRGQAQ